TASILSKVGNSPSHRSSTICTGETDTTGVAILPRNRVRTSWNGTGHACFSSNACTVLALGLLVACFIYHPREEMMTACTMTARRQPIDNSEAGTVARGRPESPWQRV